MENTIKQKFIKTENILAGLTGLISAGFAAFLPLGYLIVVLVLFAFISAFIISPGIGKNGPDVFSPLIMFPSIWIMCVAIGSRIISIQQELWSKALWAAVLAGLTGWILGCIAGIIIFNPKKSASLQTQYFPPFQNIIAQKWNGRNFNFLITLWFFAALLCTAYEFKFVIGGIPVLGGNWEEDRFMSASGYPGRLIHIISYSLLPLAMVLQAEIFSKKKIFGSDNYYNIFMLCASLFVCSLWGSRHTLFIPLSVGVILFHYLHRKLSLKHFILLGIAGVIFVGGIGYLRTSTIWENEDVEYTEVLQDLGYEGKNPVFEQAHNTIAMNFETFRLLTETVPLTQNYQYGKFTFFVLYSLLPGKQDTLGEWQNKIWNTGFYANLTSTFMGPLYVDFGIAGIFIFVFIFAAAQMMIYKNMHIKPTMFGVLLFSYLAMHTIMMAYDNTIIKLHFIVNLMLLWFTDIYCREKSERINGK